MIKISNNKQSVVQISEFFYDEKMPNSGHQRNIIKESTINQVNDLQSEIWNEENAEEFSNIDIFKCIVSDSYFSLYPDNFSNSNLSSLHIKDISENREVDLNEFSISIYQDRELINDHSSDINEHELNIPCYFDTLNKIEGNYNECL